MNFYGIPRSYRVFPSYRNNGIVYVLFMVAELRLIS